MQLRHLRKLSRDFTAIMPVTAKYQPLLMIHILLLKLPHYLACCAALTSMLGLHATLALARQWVELHLVVVISVTQALSMRHNPNIEIRSSKLSVGASIPLVGGGVTVALSASRFWSVRRFFSAGRPFYGGPNRSPIAVMVVQTSESSPMVVVASAVKRWFAVRRACWLSD